MIQLIAVHPSGSLPVVMELETDGLNFVQRHALQHLPRSGSGVPELRGLAKTDGALQFKFKIAPEKVSAGCLPELLALWDAEFTKYTLKLIAKKTKAERDAASAAGLWKDGVEKGDLNAMHQNCTPTDAQVFQQKLEGAASQAKDKARAAKAGKRMAKPKLLEAVIDATTTVNVLTGERMQIQGAAEKAVTTLTVQSVVAKVKALIGGAAGEGDRQEFEDPLEQAGTPMAGHVPEDVPEDVPAAPLATSLDTQKTAQIIPKNIPENIPGSDLTVGVASGGQQTGVVGNAQRKAGAKPPRLVEMSAQDLFKHLEKGTPGVFTDDDKRHTADFDLFDQTTALAENHSQKVGVNLTGTQSGADAEADAITAANDAVAALGRKEHQEVGIGMDGFHDDFDPFLEFAGKSGDTPALSGDTQALSSSDQVDGALTATEQREIVVVTETVAQQVATGNVKIELVPSGVDWTGLVSFRLDNHRSDARAVTLESGEVFEALGYLQVAEPLGVKVEWLLDAVGDGDMVTQDVEPLRGATDWLRAELDWRSKELMRWLGKADLVTDTDSLEGSGDKAKRITAAKKRPAGWVAAGCKLATLAQSISMDIAMLDLTVRDIERGLEGMPTWAIDAMQNIQAFSKEEAAHLPAVSRSAPGAMFRDVWREEMQRIDRWCALFASIKIARQIGLFGQQPTDHKLLVRLEQLIERTRAWRAAPAQASRVLAVWLAFVLSLDHDNRPAQPSAHAADAPESASDKQTNPAPDTAAGLAAPRARRASGGSHPRRGQQTASSQSAGIDIKEACHA